jgi:hypothetical protein
MKISIVVNADTRDGFQSQETSANQMFDGCKSADFLTEGIINKRAFFSGFDTEVIVYVDEHNKIPTAILDRLQILADCVVIRKHTTENNFNDWNYYRALSLASGDIIVHFDQDSAAFTSGKKPIENLIELLESYDYISYPSYWSPLPVIDASFDHVWSSTRFFMCKRETIDFAELKKCFDYDYWIKTYPVNRRCPWMEHWLGSMAKYNGKGVYYPPMNIDNYCIFSWGNYKQGTLRQLNDMPYSELRSWLNDHPIHYPNDVNV